MKKIFILMGALLLFVATHGQTTIEKPKFGFSTAQGITIQKIELLDTATALYFNASEEIGGGFSIPKRTYIQVVGDSVKLFVTSTNGIEFNKPQPKPDSKGTDYVLYFPKIDNSVSSLDYGEANNGGSWFIYDIELKPTKNTFPEVLFGSWYNKKTGNCELSLFDTTAVYKMKLWSYKAVKITKGEGSIVLNCNNESVELFVRKGKDGSTLFGESEKSLAEYCADISKITLTTPENDKLFELPILKNDSATLCGYIKGYNSRIPIKTSIIYVNNVFTGNQSSFTVKISPNGTYSIKIPLCYPSEVLFGTPMFGNRTAFLEPGKTLFQLFDSHSDSKVIYMGENAKLNSDLQILQPIRSFDYEDMNAKILDMTSAQYKTYCMESYKKALQLVDSINRIHPICAKANQIKKLDLEYENASKIMSYRMYFEGAYRSKNKVPQSERTLPIKIEEPTVEYYDFITNDMANNQLAVLSNEYRTFIFRLKYLNILSDGYIPKTIQELAEELQKAGVQISDEEKEYLKALLEIDTPEKKAFDEKYNDEVNLLQKKHKEILLKLYAENKDKVITNEAQEKYLVDNGVLLTDSEKELFKALKEYENSDSGKKTREMNIKYKGVARNFYKNHKSEISDIYSKQRAYLINENLERKLGVKKGFATEIMQSQDLCRSIVEEVTPVTDVKLKSIQKQFTTPFIADYIAFCNNASIAKNEENKHKTGYTINETPKTEADVLFDEMMKKFRGKVVYVDFWATWCSPCRQGIANIKPLKEELANENVVFVYITGETSPKATWDKMIPDIKGEHFRVSEDEWNFLCGKFNVAGIPHTMLVDKDGKVVNPKLPHMMNDQIKDVIMKQLKK